MPVNRYWMPIIVIIALLGTVFVAQALGLWSVSGRTSVEAGQLTPEGLKGWMTLQQVADGLGISLEEVYELGGYPADTPADTALKEMEDIAEVSDLREAMAEYLAGEGVTEEEAEAESEPEPTPESESTSEATAQPEVTATVEAHTEGGGAGAGTGDGTGPTPLPEGEILPADQIKGRMTLREVSDQCAVDLGELLAALNLPADTELDTPLRTLVGDSVLEEVSQVKDAVTALQ